jgi:two-component system sensor histidine kinase BaeS
VFRSLRFRLPAFFLVGLVLAGFVSSLIAIGLFQDYTHDRAVEEIRREAVGLSSLLASDAGDIALATQNLEEATGDRLFYVGLTPYPGAEADLEPLSREVVPPAVLRNERLVEFEFDVPGENRRYLGVSHPLDLEGSVIGSLIVAKPTTELRERSVTLFTRLALAFLGGVVVAGLFAWWVTRRITKPVQGLARAADQIASGNYDVALPEVPSDDEIGHLAERFGGMASRLRETEELERNFLMSVSHELRTPLTAIRGHVEALREGVVEDPDLRAASLDVVAAETGRLERLVGDVLDLAKLDAHRFTVLREEVDMRRLLDRAYANFTEEARRRAIDYRQEITGDAVIVSDGDRVLQIISNLLANAFRWTPDGGRIELAMAAENGTVAVAVEDSGPGVSPAERERIFRPFYSRDGGGTGLGLAIANELAGALGGRIRLDSEPGRGSRFELVLPAPH